MASLGEGRVRCDQYRAQDIWPSAQHHFKIVVTALHLKGWPWVCTSGE